MLIHISSRYFDLVPVLSNIADDLGVAGYHLADDFNAPLGKNRSHWVALTRKSEYMAKVLTVPQLGPTAIPEQLDLPGRGLVAVRRRQSGNPGGRRDGALRPGAWTDIQAQQSGATRRRGPGQATRARARAGWEPLEDDGGTASGSSPAGPGKGPAAPDGARLDALREGTRQVGPRPPEEVVAGWPDRESLEGAVGTTSRTRSGGPPKKIRRRNARVGVWTDKSSDLYRVVPREVGEPRDPGRTVRRAFQPDILFPANRLTIPRTELPLYGFSSRGDRCAMPHQQLDIETPTPTGEEGRTHERHACELPGSCGPVSSWTRPDARWGGTITNISLGGVRLRLPRRFEPGPAWPSSCRIPAREPASSSPRSSTPGPTETPGNWAVSSSANWARTNSTAFSTPHPTSPRSPRTRRRGRNRRSPRVKSPPAAAHCRDDPEPRRIKRGDDGHQPVREQRPAAGHPARVRRSARPPGGRVRRRRGSPARPAARCRGRAGRRAGRSRRGGDAPARGGASLPPLPRPRRRPLAAANPALGEVLPPTLRIGDAAPGGRGVDARLPVHSAALRGRTGGTSGPVPGGEDLTPPAPLSRRERGEQDRVKSWRSRTCLLLPLSLRERGLGGWRRGASPKTS